MPTKNLKTAKVSSKLSQLDSLGSGKMEFDVAETTDVLKTIAGEFIERVHNNLQRADKIVSGKTADLSLQETAGGIQIMANESLIYLDAGVNGSKVKLYDTPYAYKDKKPPVQPFIDWATRRNINARDNKKYYGKESPVKDADPASVGYAIREKVFQEGIKPTPVYSNEIEKLKADLAERLVDYVVQTIIKKI
jgi:hypothetical protein